MPTLRLRVDVALGSCLDRFHRALTNSDRELPYRASSPGRVAPAHGRRRGSLRVSKGERMSPRSTWSGSSHVVVGRREPCWIPRIRALPLVLVASGIGVCARGQAVVNSYFVNDGTNDAFDPPNAE